MTDVSSIASNDNVELHTEHRSTADWQNSLNGHNEHKWLLYSSAVNELRIDLLVIISVIKWLNAVFSMLHSLVL